MTVKANALGMLGYGGARMSRALYGRLADEAGGHYGASLGCNKWLSTEKRGPCCASCMNGSGACDSHGAEALDGGVGLGNRAALSTVEELAGLVDLDLETDARRVDDDDSRVVRKLREKLGNTGANADWCPATTRRSGPVSGRSRGAAVPGSPRWDSPGSFCDDSSPSSSSSSSPSCVKDSSNTDSDDAIDRRVGFGDPECSDSDPSTPRMQSPFQPRMSRTRSGPGSDTELEDLGSKARRLLRSARISV